MPLHPVKKAVVTGASRGVGYYTALSLVEMGYHVIGVARTAADLLHLQKRSRDAAGIFEPLVADVGDYTTLASLLKKSHPEINVLINNAAAFLKREFSQLQAGDLNQIYHTNVVAPVMLIQLLMPVLPAGAHCVNVSSVGGVSGSLKFKGLLPYSISKGALNIATECLALELADAQVFCNAIALGSVGTQMFKTAFPGLKAGAEAPEVGKYIAHFAGHGAPICNGRVIQLANSNP